MLYHSSAAAKSDQPAPSTIAAAWAARAPELAAWTLGRMANQTLAWGSYRAQEEVGKEYIRPDGARGILGPQTTRPMPSQRGKELLTPAVLIRHYLGRRREHIVGLHSTSPQNTSLWGAADIDWHGPTSTAPEINTATALGWFGRLRDLGMMPLLTDSNSAGGFHLEELFSRPVPTPVVYSFLKWLVSNHAAYGMAAPPEILPKQPEIRPGGLGNWLRLPGRHHTRNHWSRVWDGSRWLGGAEAVAYILVLRGDDPNLIPAEARTFTERPAQPAQPCRRATYTHNDGDDLARRITAYMSRLPSGLGEGQHRDDYAYTFAAFLVRDLALPDEAAVAWLVQWDRGNQVPKGESRLREILANAHAYAQRARGCGLEQLNRPGRNMASHKSKARRRPAFVPFTLEL
jgi:hypothetical protein